MNRYVAAAALVLLWNCGAGHTPAGQAALVEIKNGDVSALRAEFNQAAGSVRAIVLLSPT